MITYLTLILINYILFLIILNNERKVFWKIILPLFVIWYISCFMPLLYILIWLFMLIDELDLFDKLEKLLNKKIF